MIKTHTHAPPEKCSSSIAGFGLCRISKFSSHYIQAISLNNKQILAFRFCLKICVSCLWKNILKFTKYTHINNSFIGYLKDIRVNSRQVSMEREFHYEVSSIMRYHVTSLLTSESGEAMVWPTLKTLTFGQVCMGVSGSYFGSL